MINGIKPLPLKSDFDKAVDNLLNNIVIKYNEFIPDSYRECKPILVKGRKFIKVIEDNMPRATVPPKLEPTKITKPPKSIKEL